MKLRIAAILLVAFPFVIVADDSSAKSSLATALELWQPVSVTVSGARATVKTKENRVTEQIYLAMVSVERRPAGDGARYA